MSLGILSFVKKLIYGPLSVRTFVVSRLFPQQITQEVSMSVAGADIDITRNHCMICLDPFCIAVWLKPGQLESGKDKDAALIFRNGEKKRARMNVTLKERIEEGGASLLLYEVKKAACFQLNPFSRFITLFFFLKNKTSTYRQRKYIAALYSYPRKIIVVSYKEEGYCNIFPMDIQGKVPGANLYLLGLRTTNITLEKILRSGKLVVSDTANADIKTIYSLGSHLSKNPPALQDLPFSTHDSDIYGFPVPEFASSYDEVEIIQSRELGYHKLMIGRIINTKRQEALNADLYHLHIMEFLHSDYEEFTSEIYAKELFKGKAIS